MLNSARPRATQGCPRAHSTVPGPAPLKVARGHTHQCQGLRKRQSQTPAWSMVFWKWWLPMFSPASTEDVRTKGSRGETRRVDGGGGEAGRGAGEEKKNNHGCEEGLIVWKEKWMSGALRRHPTCLPRECWHGNGAGCCFLSGGQEQQGPQTGNEAAGRTPNGTSSITGLNTPSHTHEGNVLIAVKC